MALKFLTALDVQAAIDLNQNQLTNAVVHSGNSDPSSPVEGQLFYRTDTDELKYYTNAWQVVGTGSGAVDSVNGLTGVVVLDADDISDTSTTNKFATAGQLTKVDYITINQAVDLDTLESDVATNNAKVSNVTTNLSATATDSSLTINSSDGTNASVPAATTSAWGAMTDEDKTKLDGIETAATADQSDLEIETAYNNQVAQVSSSERSAGTETGIRRYAPADIKSMIDTHETNTDTDVSVANLRTRLGEISDDTSIGDAADVTMTFTGGVTIQGNLDVNGTTTTVDSTNTTIADALIELGSGNTGANTNDLGLILERGTTGNNGFIGFQEGSDKFKVGTTTATGASTGSLSVTTGTLIANIEGNVTGDVTGNADTATALETTRTIAGQNFNGTQNVSIAPTDLTGVTANATEINLLDGITTLSGSNTGDEPDASTTTKGIIEIADTGEHTTGTDATRAATPAGVKAAIDARTFASTLSTGSSSYTITHNLGTRDVIVQLYENASPYNTIFADVERDSTTQIGVNFASNLTTAVRVLITKVV